MQHDLVRRNIKKLACLPAILVRASCCMARTKTVQIRGAIFKD